MPSTEFYGQIIDKGIRESILYIADGHGYKEFAIWQSGDTYFRPPTRVAILRVPVSDFYPGLLTTGFVKTVLAEKQKDSLADYLELLKTLRSARHSEFPL